VVGGIAGGAPDALIEGETGFAVDGRSASEVARAIKILLHDPRRAKAMGERGRQWIAQEWEWKHWSAELNKLLGI
jgi:phosphatidylinositol alpha-1,6-mannosyltransferase